MVLGTLIVGCGMVVFPHAIVVVSSFVAARRVGVASVIASHVVPHWKLRHVIFSLVLHVGSITTLATVCDGSMVVFLRTDMVPNFANSDVRLIVIGEWCEIMSSYGSSGANVGLVYNQINWTCVSVRPKYSSRATKWIANSGSWLVLNEQ
jgi:hypothetical protein